MSDADAIHIFKCSHGSDLCNIIASIAQTSLSFPHNFIARYLHNTVING